MGDWIEVRFKDLLSEPVRNGLYKPKEFHGRGDKIVNMGELFAHSRLRSVPMRRVALTEHERERFSLQAFDLLFARRSLVAEGAGKCSLVLEVGEATTFESSIVRARPDPQKASAEFLYYFFSSPVGKHALDTIRRQVAVAGITGKDLENLVMLAPPLQEQRAIARILGALDDKIELNRRLNETLEATARALFKEWFDEAADAWPTPTLASMTSYLSRGISPAYLSEGGICVLNQKCIRENRIDFSKARRHDLEKRGVEGRRIQLLDVLVNSTGVGTLGRVAQVWRLPEEAIVDSHVTIVRAAPSVDPWYLGFAILTREEEIEALGEGSTGQTELSRTRLGAMELPAPPQEAQEKFSSSAAPLIERLVLNEKQAETLTSLRDTLLPKLISGELRVKDAEKVVEAAA